MVWHVWFLSKSNFIFWSALSIWQVTLQSLFGHRARERIWMVNNWRKWWNKLYSAFFVFQFRLLVGLSTLTLSRCPGFQGQPPSVRCLVKVRTEHREAPQHIGEELQRNLNLFQERLLGRKLVIYHLKMKVNQNAKELLAAVWLLKRAEKNQVNFMSI